MDPRIRKAVGFAVLLSAASAWAQPAAHSAAGAPVAPALERALAEAAADDWLKVGVVLREDDLPAPAAGQVAGLDEAAARLEGVASRQGRVLGALPGGAFHLKRRYRLVAGLAVRARPAAVEALRRHPEVRFLYLDGRVTPSLAQGVPLVGADQAHALGVTGEGITVAILDTGIDTDHPDLAPDLVGEQCYCSDPHPSPVIGSPCCPGGGETQSGAGAAEDDDGHGTNVAGIVTATGVVAGPGVAPDATVVAVRVLGPTGGDFSDIAAGLDWVLLNKDSFGAPIRVVNLSLGDSGEYGDPPPSNPCQATNTANAIAALASAGVAVFAASGNDGHDDGVAFPACVPEAIAVGGVYDASFSQVSWCGNASCTTTLCTDSNVGPDDFVCHSNSGALLDLLAPNYATRTTNLGGGIQNFFGGTSASSPYAAAQAALLLEADASLSPAQVRDLLVGSGPSVTDPKNGLAFPRGDVGEIVPALVAECGNGALEPGEDCDDGGTAGGDCCAADCSFEAAAASCDDGDACTLSDACDGAGICVGGGPPDCDDGDACTAESCDALAGCVSTPIEGCSAEIPALPGPWALPLLGLLAAAGGWQIARRRS